MLKVVYYLSRKSDLSEAEFRRHWRDVHVPLVMRLPGLRRYRISPVTGSLSSIPSGARPPDIDGIAELFYDDPTAFRAAQASAEMAAAEADVPRFTSQVTAHFVDEVLLVE